MKKLLLLITISAFTLMWACDQPSGGGGCRPPAGKITVTGPITGGNGIPQAGTILDLPTRGYIEEEFFFEGEATSYQVQGEKGSDGKWTVTEADTAGYKTRMLVRRPVNADDFNGTVVVEWLNVSAGADGAPGFMFNMPEILRGGYAWVGVSAQKVGVGGGMGMMPGALPLQKFDPERYGSLNHPGDAYSYDIYNSAAKVIKGEGSKDVLGGLKAKYLMAYGESQSAGTMITYTNAVQLLAKLYDGIFIHSRGATGHPLNPGSGGGCNAAGNRDGGLKVRTDLDVPVMQFETEGDVIGLGFYPARQPDTDMIRTWEVAGTAHADAYLGDYFQYAELEERLPEEVLTCEGANSGPQYIVLRAALRGLDQWMKEGVAPPKSEPIEMEGSEIIRDEHGNALGGIRTPDVDVPIATLLPRKQGGGIMCGLFGSTEPFSSEKLLELYRTHEDYVTKFTASAEATVAAGFMLEPEKEAIIADAQAAAIPF